MAKTGISRRRFMKTSAAGIVSAFAGIHSVQRTFAEKETYAVSRTSLKSLLAIPTTCEQCPAGCGIIACLNGDRLVQILGNPDHPNNMGGICARGTAGINLVNDPERLLYPMKRIGPRGKGKWTRITWDEVYTKLSERMKKLIESRRVAECVFDIGTSDSLLERFVEALGSAKTIDRQSLKNLNRATVYFSMVGAPSLIEDVGRSRTIVNFGANPYAHHDQFISFSRRLMVAQAEKGARLITFDVRMSETAARSDLWYPVKAGTDGAVGLAMAKVIVDKGLADENFIESMTNVRLSTLKAHLSGYTPEHAERESGVKAEDIVRIAKDFATQKPSVAIIGGGITDHQNGSQNVRCIALLNCLAGNFEKEGGLFFPRSQSPGMKTQQAEFPPLEQKNRVKGLSELEEAHTPIDTYFAFLSNPAYSEPEGESASRFLQDENKVPFIVVMDTHLTETAEIADIVLPAATYLEGWGLKSTPSSDNISVLSLQQPAVSLLSDAEVLRSPLFEEGKIFEPCFRPLGDAKEIGNVCLELCQRIGGTVSQSLPFSNTQDYITRLIYSLKGKIEDEGLQDLKRKGFWKGFQAQKAILGGTKKVNILSKALHQQGHNLLPVYQPIPAHREKKKDEFILTTFKPALLSAGTTNSKWACEILHENRLWMNADTANSLGIKNGDKVRVTSSAGTLTTRVITTHRIHPESVALAEGLGHTAVGNVARARKFKSKDGDTILIWWGKEGNGVNPHRIIERHKDPLGGGQGLKDTVVRIEKIKKTREDINDTS